MKPKIKLTAEGERLHKLGYTIFPRRATSQSAGLDLFPASEEPIIINPKETVKVYTGVRIWLDTCEELSSKDFGLAGFYLPRSSNKSLQLENTVGLLDADFQGESFLKLHNKHGLVPAVIYPNIAIAQLVIFPVWLGKLHFDTSDWEITERGEGGDGSTTKTS